MSPEKSGTFAGMRDDPLTFAEFIGRPLTLMPYQRHLIDALGVLGGRNDVLVISWPAYEAMSKAFRGASRNADDLARYYLSSRPLKPSHKLTPLERAAQGRAARAEMVRRKP